MDTRVSAVGLWTTDRLSVVRTSVLFMASGAAVDEAPVHDLHRCLTDVADAITLGLEARAWSLPTEEVRAALVEVAVQQRRLEALRAHLVRASSARDDGTTPGTETAAFLAAKLKMSRGKARAEVETAALADPEDGTLRAMGAAVQAGRFSMEYVDAARRGLAGVPCALLAKRRGEVDEVLTRHASTFNGRDFSTIANHLGDTLAPTEKDELDAFERERRSLIYAMSERGVLRGTFRLEGRDAADTKILLDHLSAPSTDTGAVREDGQRVLPGITDIRTLEQRRADALAQAARLAAAHARVGTRAGEPPQLLIHTTIEQLAWKPDTTSGGEPFVKPAATAQAAATGSAAGGTAAGLAPPGPAECAGIGPISHALLQAAACDAVLQRVVLDQDGAIVEMRSPQRLANRAQRRALAARDRGCAFPGCGAPPSACEAHHVIWWTRGGETIITNLVLLCPRHHTEIHAGDWNVAIRGGVPWFTPPRWLDPDQAPIRNTVHDAVAEIRTLAQQLRLDLDSPRPHRRE
jgi:hypothetical protein